MRVLFVTISLVVGCAAAPSVHAQRTRRRAPRASLAQIAARAGALSTSGDAQEPVDARVPDAGRAFDASECRQELSRRRIDVALVRNEDAAGVVTPVHPRNAIGAVEFVAADRSERHAILDCRLALALELWSHDLAARGVRRVEHYSAYRPGAVVAGTRRASGHAHGLALDAARFHLDDGRVLDVLTHWRFRDRGAEPCAPHPGLDADDQLIRDLVCGAVSRGLFQVVVTPHRDHAHRNHVHVEVVPDVTWTYVH